MQKINMSGKEEPVAGWKEQFSGLTDPVQG